jgi:hypothetical protein
MPRDHPPSQTFILALATVAFALGIAAVLVLAFLARSVLG